MNSLWILEFSKLINPDHFTEEELDQVVNTVIDFYKDGKPKKLDFLRNIEMYIQMMEKRTDTLSILKRSKLYLLKQTIEAIPEEEEVSTLNTDILPDREEPTNTLQEDEIQIGNEVHQVAPRRRREPLSQAEIDRMEAEEEEEENETQSPKEIQVTKEDSVFAAMMHQLDQETIEEDVTPTPVPTSRVEEETQMQEIKERIPDKITMEDGFSLDLTEGLAEANADVKVEPVLFDEASIVSAPSVDPNITIEEVTFDQICQHVQKEADPKILRDGGGSRLERFKKYRESEISGRKIYLPDSNYEVTIKQVKDKSQVSFLLNIMSEYVSLDEVQVYLKEEMIRILYHHTEFPWPNVSFVDFTKNVSPNDLELMFATFALVNIKEAKDGTIPLEIKYLQCSDCESVITLKNPMQIDLRDEFKRMYDVERWIHFFTAYKRTNWASIHHAYASSEYGKITKVSFEDEIASYHAYFSRPSAFKINMIKSQYDHICYTKLANVISDRLEFLRNTISNIDDMLEYLNTHNYAQYKADLDAIRESGWESIDFVPEDKQDEYKLIMNLNAQHGDMMQEYASIFMIAMLIEYVEIIPKNGDVSFKFECGTTAELEEFMDSILELPEPLIQSLTEISSNDTYISKTILLTFTAEEMQGRLDFESVHIPVREFEEKCRESGMTEDQIKTALSDREKKKQEFDSKPNCLRCGHGEYKLTYNTLLFFSIASLLK